MSEQGAIAVVIRPEAPRDAAAIRALTARAFEGLSFSDGTEPLVIDALREADGLVLSLVALLGNEIVGHVAFSQAGPSEQGGWLTLGPVSVDPQFQRRGIGSQLIRAGLQVLREQGADGCVLVGDPRYYGRFGFAVTPTCAPPDCPPQYFQVLPFGDSLPAGHVSFHPAFSVQAKPRRADLSAFSVSNAPDER